jgi:glycosyltransferase involved in cell wall biosynthesis
MTEGLPMKKRRIAFVVQRCGREVNGGAEAHCLAMAKRMSKHWDVEILTSCAVDYVTWENSYPRGQEEVGGVVIRRFPVAAARVTEKFNQLSSKLHGKRGAASAAEEQEWLQAQGPWCPELASYIGANSREYDVYIFFTYLYWHTWAALPKVADRAILVPLAHDEWTIYLNIFKELFARARHFIFNTIEEKRFLERLIPEKRFDGPVVGVSVDRPSNVDPLKFRQEHGLQEDFLLYVGRIDPSKGCGELFDFFLRHRQDGRSPSKLVLLGKPVMDIPNHPDIVSLGFVSEETKWNALAASEALLMPSAHESLSMVLLEAWSVGRPVIVNGRCEVLVGQCRRSNGGLWYENYAEWAGILERLQSGRASNVLGRQGWRFVQEHYSWDSIEHAYLDAVESIVSAGCGKAKDVVESSVHCRPLPLSHMGHPWRDELRQENVSVVARQLHAHIHTNS